MTKTLATLALAMSLTAGCTFISVQPQMVAPPPLIHGGGGAAQWQMDANICAKEAMPFGFIPDYGITRDIKLVKCMKDRGWVWAGGPDWELARTR